MPEQLDTENEAAVRRIAREHTMAGEVERVETLTGPNEGEILVQVADEHAANCRNAFGGMALEGFLREGFIATSVAAGPDCATAWFKPVDIGIEVEDS